MKEIKSKQDSKETKDKIIDLFFEKHIQAVNIAKELKVSQAYITKVIQKNARYIKEKETRKAENREKNKIQKRESARNRRAKEKEERQEYEKLQKKINKDNEYLSTKKKKDDLQYAQWNRSIYCYDGNTSDLVLKSDIVTGYNVAKRVSNVVNPNIIKSKKIYV